MHRKIQPGVSGVGQTTSQDPQKNLDEKETQKRNYQRENLILGGRGWGDV